MLQTEKNKDFTGNQLQALDSARNVSVRANAGSGKTTVLVDRLLQILHRYKPGADAYLAHDNFELESIVSITFTRKAAGELRCRLTSQLETLAQQKGIPSEEKGWWNRCLDQVAQAPIGTIDSFCARILREFTLWDKTPTRIDPDFTMLEDYDADHLLRLAFQSLKQKIEFDEKLEVAFKELNRLDGEESIANYLNALVKHPAGVDAILEKNPLITDIDAAVQEKMNTHQLVVKAKKKLPGMQKTLERMLDKIAPLDKNKFLLECEANGKEALSQFQKGDAFSLICGFEKMRKVLCNDKGEPRSLSFFKVVAEEMGSLQDDWAKGLKDFNANFHLEKPALALRNNMCALLKEFHAQYLLLCKQANAFDFDTVARKVLSLLSQFPPMREELKKRYRYFQVDEFQDTSALQWQILFYLVGNGIDKLDENRLFIVGDPQQSIYCFRNADVAVFKTVEQFITLANQENKKASQPLLGEPASKNPEWLDARKGLVCLPENFRTLGPAPLDFVNEVILHEFNPKGLLDESAEPFHVPFARLEKGLATEEQGEVIYLDATAEKKEKALAEGEKKNPGGDEEEGEDLDKLEIQAQMICQEFIRLKGQQRKKESRDGTREELKWRDMAVLFPARTGILPTLSKVFRQRGVPIIVNGGVGFWERLEVRDLMQLVKALSVSGDDLALFSVLRGPFSRLSDSEIFFLHHLGGKFARGINLLQNSNPELASACEKTRFSKMEESKRELLSSAWEKFSQESRERMALACQRLGIKGSWRLRADRMGHADLLRLCLEESGAWAAFSSWEDGDQAVGNVKRFLEMVLKEEKKPGANLLRVAQYLQGRSDHSGKESQASLETVDADAVQLMTIHGAKGLEFPVVALARMEKDLLKGPPVLLAANPRGEFVLKVRPEDSPLEVQTSPGYQEIKKGMDQRKLAESKRLLYVGMTRAEETLILAGSTPSRKTECSWKSWVESALDLTLEDWIKGEKKIGPSESVVVQLRAWEGEKSASPAREPAKVPSKVDIQSISEQPSRREVGATYLEKDLDKFQNQFGEWLMMGKHKVLLHHGGLPEGWPGKRGGENQRQTYGALLGRVIHRVFERFTEFSHLEIGRKNAWVQELVAAEIRLASQENEDEDETLVLDENENERLFKEIWHLIPTEKDGEIARLANCSGSVEADFILPLGSLAIQGRMDKLYQNGEEWEIVDWKSESEPVEKSVAKHLFQMRLYALALLRSGIVPVKQKEIRVHLVLLRHKKVEVIRFSRDELNEWEAVLRGQFQKMEEQLLVHNPG